MHSLELSRTLDASPDRVWHALTDPDALAAWFWPTAYDTKVDADIRVGGRYRFAAPNAPGGGITVSGEYLAVDPPHRLVFTWAWDGDPDPPTLVTVTLTPAGDTTTTLLLTHSGFTTPSDRANHEAGWTSCLTRLPPFLSSVDLG